MASGGSELETVVVRHWRAVSDDGGIALSYSQRDGFDKEIRVRNFCDEHPQYHFETWDETFSYTPSTWERVG